MPKNNTTIVVIGAGMVGTSIAWHLNHKGFNCILIDKKAPGEETSFGNAGLIQREAIFPHSFPTSLTEFLGLLPNTATSFRYQTSAVLKNIWPLYHYWRNSFAKQYANIIKQWSSLIIHCSVEHEYMFSKAGAENLISKTGWLQLHHKISNFNKSVAKAKFASEFGVQSKILDPVQLGVLEPDLNLSNIVGAIHWLNSWQVTNPGQLVKTYAKHYVNNGGKILQDQVIDINPIDNTTWQVTTTQQQINTTKVVLATGPWASNFTKKLGYKFPLFPLRGYHRHFTLKPNKTINHPILELDHGFYLGQMQMGIRLTTGGEFTNMTAKINMAQITATEKIARQLFPIDKAIEDTPWFGHRPCIADMKPIIGPAPKHTGLYFAFAHAHQGFTLGPITGRLIAELINKQETLVDLAPFSAQRFIT